MFIILLSLICYFPDGVVLSGQDDDWSGLHSTVSIEASPVYNQINNGAYIIESLTYFDTERRWQMKLDPPPLLTDVCAFAMLESPVPIEGLIFSDGFESGGVERWN